MKSDELNKWLTLAANVGVILGLILVAYEINQSGTSLQLEASSDGVDDFAQAMEVLVSNEDLARLIYRAETAYEELDDFDRWRVNKYLDGFMSMSQQDFRVYISIADTENALAMKDDWRENMKLQMFSDYWSKNEARFRPEWQQFINDILAESE